MTDTTLKLADRKGFTAVLAIAALAVFACFAIAITTPGCAFTKSVLGPTLATCGTSAGLTAASQFDNTVQAVLSGESFQSALTALENDGEEDAIQGVICAVQKVAFSEATTATPAGPTTLIFTPKFSATQVAHAKAYLASHK